MTTSWTIAGGALVPGSIDGGGRRVAVTIHQGRIAALAEEAGTLPNDPEGRVLAPGLIDLQINGAYGEDFTADPEAIWRVGTRLPEQGVTAFLPTIVSSPTGTIGRAFDALRARPPGYRGAEPLGLHLEGPMLSPLRPGVHNPEYLRPPTLELIEGWHPGAGVAMATIAPELPGAEAVIRELRRRGVVVAAGHTAASYDQAKAGFEWGITVVTHLFNAMEPFSHRAPGLIGALVEHPAVVAGVIADGVHVHPAAVGAAWRWLRPHRMALVTDAMAGAGGSAGDYPLGGTAVTVHGGRPVDALGRLAGSVLTLDQAVRNLIEFAGCPVAEAVAAASTVPAIVLAMADRGRMAVGARADLAVLDRSLRVVTTVIDGDVVWRG